MRIILAATILLALAACSRKADNEFRDNIRTSGIAACSRDMRAQLVREARWTDDMAPEIREVCGCFVERSMDNVPTTELVARAARERTPAEQAERERILAACREPFERRDMTAAQRNADPSRASRNDLESVTGAPPVPAASGPAPAVRARPMAALASLATDDDYPAAALRSEEQGRTAFALEIGPDGRVTQCTITASSGSAALDAATCRIMRARALYEPARDAGGAPAADRDQGQLNWTLPTR